MTEGFTSTRESPTRLFIWRSRGGTNRTSGLSVSGVGAANREQIEKVFYRAFTQILPANANFSTARAATIQSARDLYGAGGAVERAVIQAWTAVGVQLTMPECRRPKAEGNVAGHCGMAILLLAPAPLRSLRDRGPGAGGSFNVGLQSSFRAPSASGSRFLCTSSRQPTTSTTRPSRSLLRWRGHRAALGQPGCGRCRVAIHRRHRGHRGGQPASPLRQPAAIDRRGDAGDPAARDPTHVQVAWMAAPTERVDSSSSAGRG